MSHKSSKALLLTAPGCIHCASLKKILEKIVAEGLIEQLEVVDITSNPEIANRHNVKSVPWLKLGLFEFQGAQRESELRYWLTQLDSQQGISRYIKHLLETGLHDKLEYKFLREWTGSAGKLSSDTPLVRWHYMGKV